MSISQIQIRSFKQLLDKRHEVTVNNTLPVGLPDAAAYFYLKEASSFFGRKEERWQFYFFQGLNTNPQNLSIYLRDEAQRQAKSNPKFLIKQGVFAIYDLFGKADVVVEISIPGNLKIYKLVNGKKELVNNEEMDLMYLSSVFRTMYQINLPWGRSHILFHDSKNYLHQLHNFLNITFRSLTTRDIQLGPQFQASARVKGSHACSLIFNHIKERRLLRQTIQIIEELFSKNKQYKDCFKYGILLSELYMQFGKPSKSIDIVFSLLNTHPSDSYLLFYQAKYLHQSGLLQQAFTVASSIVQFNQFQIWMLIAQLRLELKNYGETLICLNHAVKMSKIKAHKNIDIAYRAFEQLGKIKTNSSADSIERNPKLLFSTDNPLNILVKEVEEKNKFMIERGYWKLNANEKLIYCTVQQLRYKLESKKFEQLLMNTFEDNIVKYEPVSIRKGIPSGKQEEPSTVRMMSQQTRRAIEEEGEQDLPGFLRESFDKVEQDSVVHRAAHLSIIQQIESVIQNSNYEQRQRQTTIKKVRLKREVNQGLFRIIQLVLSQSEFQKAQYENNVAKILPTYNKMRTSSKFNNYYSEQMFKIFVQTGNYKSIIVLIAETLDFLEQRGIRKMDKLPFWMHKHLYFIIQEKGLKFLNQILQKLNFYDEAVIDTIQLAKNWKMKGVTY